MPSIKNTPLSGSRANKKKVEEAIKAAFKPQFLNRIDELIHFNALTRHHITQIFDLELLSLQQRIKKQHHLTLSISPAAKEHLGTKGYSATYGARELARTIERELLTKLTDMILEGRLQAGDVVTVDYNGVQLVFGKA